MSTSVLSDKNRAALMSKAALLHNIAEIRRAGSGQQAFCAVVKANAYGHGAVDVARILEADGIDMFAVATFEEAQELREAGIKTPILILGIVPLEHVVSAARQDVSITVHTVQYGRDVLNRLRDEKESCKVHIKLDTGMTRLGFATDEASIETTCREIVSLFSDSHLIPEGLFSHFAASEADAAFTASQIERFCLVKDRLEMIPFRYFHIANSGACRLQDETFNLLRAGIVMYGGSPDPALETGLDLRPVMSVMGRVVQIKTLKEEETVGYSRSETMPAGSRLAIVELGYADGVPRQPSSTGHFLIDGQKARIVGRVSMDRVALDVTSLEVNVGDWALFFGQQNGNMLTADEVALLAGTISYELFCRVASRVPRIWI